MLQSGRLTPLSPDYPSSCGINKYTVLMHPSAIPEPLECPWDVAEALLTETISKDLTNSVKASMSPAAEKLWQHKMYVLYCSFGFPITEIRQ